MASMSDRRPESREDEPVEELREECIEQGDRAGVEAIDAMRELWESGEMQAMIESGDYSDLPAAVRPDADDTDA
jgi:hypothetical protein